jgi:hypothetical protein
MLVSSLNIYFAIIFTHVAPSPTIETRGFCSAVNGKGCDATKEFPCCTNATALALCDTAEDQVIGTWDVQGCAVPGFSHECFVDPDGVGFCNGN